MLPQNNNAVQIMHLSKIIAMLATMLVNIHVCMLVFTFGYSGKTTV